MLYILLVFSSGILITTFPHVSLPPSAFSARPTDSSPTYSVSVYTVGLNLPSAIKPSSAFHTYSIVSGSSAA